MRNNFLFEYTLQMISYVRLKEKRRCKIFDDFILTTSLKGGMRKIVCGFFILKFLDGVDFMF